MTSSPSWAWPVGCRPPARCCRLGQTLAASACPQQQRGPPEQLAPPPCCRSQCSSSAAGGCRQAPSAVWNRIGEGRGPRATRESWFGCVRGLGLPPAGTKLKGNWAGAVSWCCTQTGWGEVGWASSNAWLSILVLRLSRPSQHPAPPKFMAMVQSVRGQGQVSAEQVSERPTWRHQTPRCPLVPEPAAAVMAPPPPAAVGVVFGGV